MCKVTVIDSIMGSGKTSFVIKRMNKGWGSGPYLYVCPYLREVGRIIDKCPQRYFEQPTQRGSTKLESLKDLMGESKNIATTHELLRHIDKEALRLVEEKGYTLILDEALQTIEVADKVERSDIKHLIDTKTLIPGGMAGENDRIRSLIPGKIEPGNRYIEIMQWAKTERLFIVDDTVMLWVLPPRTFKAFKKVWVLSYLFEGQLMSVYFKVHGIEFVKKAVVDPEGRGNYCLVNFFDIRDDHIKDKLASLIRIYEGSYNDIHGPGKRRTDPKYALSFTYYDDEASVKRRAKCKEVANKTRAFLTSFIKPAAKAEDVMWTVFKDLPFPESARKKRMFHLQSYMTPPGNGSFNQSFVSCSQRATNDYRDKSVLAYLINVFPNPHMKRYFKLLGLAVSEDEYALSEMLQWIFRSRIRDFNRAVMGDRSIDIFIPSKRMRDLLEGWLKNNLISSADEIPKN